MTVKELIHFLQAYPDDTLVFLNTDLQLLNIKEVQGDEEVPNHLVLS